MVILGVQVLGRIVITLGPILETEFDAVGPRYDDADPLRLCEVTVYGIPAGL
jgi:hypothetical protein